MKGEVDPVTAMDEAAEEAIIDVLSDARPDDAVLGEESGGAGWREGRVWVVDPLDGTVNFVHGIPHVAVSVALWEDGAPLAGVVIDVTRNEEFSVVAGNGAHLDGTPISVSVCQSLGDAVVATGFPYDRRRHAMAYAETVGHVLGRVQGIRRIGSAALDLAWTACGRFDAYWEYGLHPWDSAAGLLLVKEAGGVVTGRDGSAYDLDSPVIVAAAPLIHEGLARLVADHLPEHLR